jgi:hypothetical protein
MEKNLKSLDEYNGERVQYHFNLMSEQPRLNGIACPKCGEELVDTNPMVTLTSYPPQKNVNCLKCEYIGYRIA